MTLALVRRPISQALPAVTSLSLVSFSLLTTTTATIGVYDYKGLFNHSRWTLVIGMLLLNVNMDAPTLSGAIAVKHQ